MNNLAAVSASSLAEVDARSISPESSVSGISWGAIMGGHLLPRRSL
jgi:hypothetical protein